MNSKKWGPYAASIIIALAVGFLSGLSTSTGMLNYEQLMKPPLTPPSVVFPIVWPILYILMGISAAMIWKSESPYRKKSLGIYAVQLLVNAVWSVIFFTFQAYFFAFLWLILLWVLILKMILCFYRIDPLAGLLQIPYLLWVSFAGYLSCAIWLLNR